MTTPTLSERLRQRAGQFDSHAWHSEIEIEAADELDRLRDECARLRDALQHAKDSLVAFKFMPASTIGHPWEDSDEANLAAVDAAMKGQP